MASRVVTTRQTLWMVVVAMLTSVMTTGVLFMWTGLHATAASAPLHWNSNGGAGAGGQQVQLVECLQEQMDAEQPDNGRTAGPAEQVVAPPSATSSIRLQDIVTEGLLSKAQFANWNETEIQEFSRHPVAKFDIVYTWVNGSDRAHTAARIKYKGPVKNHERYRDNGELRWSLRSLDMYMPWWTGNLYIVGTEVPCWLNTAHPRVRLVHHRDLFSWQDLTLPTFNVDAVESFLFRLPDISEQFLYFNDDMFLGRMARPTDFVENGKPVLRLQRAPSTGAGRLFTEAWAKSKKAIAKVGTTRKVFTANRLFREKYHISDPDKFFRHLQPTPQVLNRTRLETLWVKYGNDLKATVLKRFRLARTVSIPFLHHYDCILDSPDDCAIADAQDFRYYRIGNMRLSELFSLVNAFTLGHPLYLTVDDGVDSASSELLVSSAATLTEQRQWAYRMALPAAYPFESQWETTQC